MRSAAAAAAAAALVLLALAGAARAAPVPEPSGPHPRMLLDDELRAAWRADAATDRGPVAAALRVCRAAREPGPYAREGYQGWSWAKALQACLVAWAATGAPEHAATALRFFTALIDDLEVLGDGKGGDTSAQRDDGYAIRNLGPFTALAYDWLHAAPGMTPALRARARARWHAWLTWYRAHGYRARFPGTNYQAGFLAAATAIAVAQAGEAGPIGAELWRFVADELWAKDMAAALAPGGILEGGDWPEGWQYGPLAVGNYALAMRIARGAGIAVPGEDAWLASVLRRHVHAMSPSERLYAGGDTQFPVAYLGTNELSLTAIALGGAPAQARRWARGERARLGLGDEEAVLFDSLGMAGEPGEPIPRATWPTWYLARGTGTLYARTRWDDRAVWFVAECQRKLPADHRHSNAGTFVLSRGRDDAIVDPTPYGSLSSLTSNAPTVASAVVPVQFAPSQFRSSERTGWRWAVQTRSGVVAARCDYADQFRTKDRPSDVHDAIRDLVVLPGEDGTDASVVVADRAISGAADRPMHLRFRVPGAALAFRGDPSTAAATLGGTRLAIAGLSRSAGTPRLVPSTEQECPQGKLALKGRCEAARFPVTDYRLEVAGPAPRAVHVLSATGGDAPAPVALDGDGWQGVRVTAARDAVVIWPLVRGAALRYRAPRGEAVTHVVLDAPAVDGAARVTARPDGDACAVEVAAAAGAGAIPARPVIAVLDEACGIAADPPRPTQGAIVATTDPPPSPVPPPPRAGGCGQTAALLSLLAIPLGAGLLWRRGRRRRRAPRG